MSDSRRIEALERNEQRATCAGAAITAYATVKENNTTDMWDFSSQNAQELLTDLLADLRHWARQHNLDFAQAAMSAESHFQCELDEEAQEEPLEKGGKA